MATGRPRSPDAGNQPEFYYALLKASILKLPDDWGSIAQRLVLDQRNPSLNDLSDCVSRDIAQSAGDLPRLLCFETLLKFTSILRANEHSLRSAGPA